ncbi:hypothetical protein K7X08_013498 [Anisodus acutangulus]|uniref:FRIGIDA-like protein n=1 Tax=Anisodus acutangulus TaxID=402998 RepID=A0A9Q1R444_9SOLA|nr:hypothetical protein K7X08_013498 [Anisodus acutangulus]
MVKNKLEVDAVDAVYTFGVEGKCSPYTILSSFLEELKESSKRKKWKSYGSHAVVDEANKRELSTMKSVMECLEAHNIDHSKLIARFRISDRIMSLEEKIAREDQRREKMVRIRYLMKLGHPEGGTARHIYGYSVSPPVLAGPVAGLIPDTVPGNASIPERPVSHNYGYGPSPPWQGSMGLPHTVPIGPGPGNQTSASDPYQLVNTIPGSAPYQNSGFSHAVGAVASVNNHSFFLYPPGTYYPQGMQ